MLRWLVLFMHVSVLTRPDITYALGIVTRHRSSLTNLACKACRIICVNLLHCAGGGNSMDVEAAVH